MNLIENLEQIRLKYQSVVNDSLIIDILKRKDRVSLNNVQKDILITGINPSFRNGECMDCPFYNFQNEILSNENWDVYWSPLKRMLYNNEFPELDYRNSASYIDIFSFREKNQKILRTKILNSNGGIEFITSQLKLTQEMIEEVIKPKVIIVKNKESEAYWGKCADKNLIWMGYAFEKIKDCNSGEIYRIIGLCPTDRIFPELQKTNLLNSIVLFTSHINQYTKKEKKPTPETIKELFEIYNSI